MAKNPENVIITSGNRLKRHANVSAISGKTKKDIRSLLPFGLTKATVIIDPLNDKDSIM